MTPTMQTKFGREGNCFAACVASILEVPIATVLDVPHRGDWFPEFQAWLLSKHNLHAFCFPATKAMQQWMVKVFDRHYIASGNSPRLSNTLHAVVAYKGELVHDPYPGGTFVTEIVDIILFLTPEEYEDSNLKEQVAND